MAEEQRTVYMSPGCHGCLGLSEVSALGNQLESARKLVKLIMALNIVSTVVPAMLITASLERFEVIAHEIEYVNAAQMKSAD